MSDSTLKDFDENGDSICSNFNSSNEIEQLEDESLENLTIPLYDTDYEFDEIKKESIGSGLLAVKKRKNFNKMGSFNQIQPSIPYLLL